MVQDPDEIKSFVSNASEHTPVETLLLVAFSRWRVESCFQDSKVEIGLDQREGRKYLGLKRHLTLSSASYLFLSQLRERWKEEKTELTICQVRTVVGALIQSWWLNGQASTQLIEQAAGIMADTRQRTRSQVPHGDNPPNFQQKGIRLANIKQRKWP